MGRLLLAVALAACIVGACTALPFGPKSAVTELTPKTLPAFMNTHKPVFLMLYAPWCGHCKQMHPAFEKFAKSVKDVVKVAAINADEHRDIAQRYGVQGFPTIKYWGIGPKKGKAPMDYQGGRTAGPMQTAALREVNNKKVTTVATMDAMRKLVEGSEAKKAVLLMSSKAKSPPMFSVLSHSPHFSPLGFAFATDKAADVKEHFHVGKVPAILTVGYNSEGEVEGKPYDGPIDYTSIAKHLQAELGVAGGDAAADEKPAEDKKAEEKPAEEKKPEEKKAPKPAAPVTPVELTAESWQKYCAHGAPKVQGSQPLCVVAMKNGVFDVSELHDRFSHEPVLFLHPAADDDVAEAFAAELKTEITSDALVVVRAGKGKTRFAVWTKAEGAEVFRTAGTDSFEEYLGRCLTGDATMQRISGFPALPKSE